MASTRNNKEGDFDGVNTWWILPDDEASDVNAKIPTSNQKPLTNPQQIYRARRLGLEETVSQQGTPADIVGISDTQRDLNQQGIDQSRARLASIGMPSSVERPVPVVIEEISSIDYGQLHLPLDVE